MSSRTKERVLLFTVLCLSVYMVVRLRWPQHFEKLKLPEISRKVTRDTANCNSKEVNFRDPRSKPKNIALSSYPGSGSQWVRKLIEQSTGIATGSVYCNQRYEDTFFKGNCYDDDTVLTHEWFDKPKYEKAVLLIRSPYKSFGTYFSKEINKDPSDKDFEKALTSFLNRLLPNWFWYNMEWLRDFKGPILILFFDKLKHDLASEMEKIMKFLDVEYNEQDFKCMLKLYSDEDDLPRQQQYDIKKVMSPAQLTELENNITIIEKMAEKTEWRIP